MNTVFFETCRTLNLPNDFRFPSLFLGDVNLSKFNVHTYYWLVAVDEDFKFSSKEKRIKYLENIALSIFTDLMADEQIGLVKIAPGCFKSDPGKKGYASLPDAALFVFDVLDCNFWEQWPDTSSKLAAKHINWLLYHPFASHPNSMVGMSWSLF